MAREIKFRAWEADRKYMAIQGTPDLEDLQAFMFHYSDQPLMMQYTGLKDKNGVEIYEGDLLGHDEAIHRVYWSEWESCWNIKTLNYKGEWEGGIYEDLSEWIELNSDTPKLIDGEVIGNIYENKELLNA